MRRLITAALATAALVLTGCGSEEPDPAATKDSPSATRSPDPTPSSEPEPTRSPEPSPEPEPSSEPAPQPEPTESPEPQTSVDSVTMTRSGGFAGVSQTWRIGPSDPGHGPVFAAASPEALEGAEGSTGKPPCCDLFQYRLTVSYSDGTVESFRVYAGASADRALTHLVSAVAATQPSSGPVYR
jgi:hypothetical protein